MKKDFCELNCIGDFLNTASGLIDADLDSLTVLEMQMYKTYPKAYFLKIQKSLNMRGMQKTINGHINHTLKTMLNTGKIHAELPEGGREHLAELFAPIYMAILFGRKKGMEISLDPELKMRLHMDS